MAMNPDHKVSIWATDDGIFVEAEGETLRFPTNEPVRLVAWLRQRWLNSQHGPHTLRDAEREQRAKEWNAAWKVNAAADQRSYEEARAEHEERKKKKAEERKRSLVKRADKAKLAKEADEFFREMGL